MAELTDEEIAQEEKFMKGLPRLNVGAFFMPPIWGPVHGFWVTILYYPAWLIADNLFFATYLDPSGINVAMAVTVAVLLLGVTAAFAIVSQPIAAHRAEDKGVSRQAYLKRQRVWAAVSIALAVAVVALATYYNLNIRTEV